MQRRDVMGWTTGIGEDIGVTAWGSGDFGLMINGVVSGRWLLDKELCALRSHSNPGRTFSVTPERMAALVALDATATRTRAILATWEPEGVIRKRAEMEQLRPEAQS